MPEIVVPALPDLTKLDLAALEALDTTLTANFTAIAAGNSVEGHEGTDTEVAAALVAQIKDVRAAAAPLKVAAAEARAGEMQRLAADLAPAAPAAAEPPAEPAAVTPPAPEAPAVEPLAAVAPEAPAAPPAPAAEAPLPALDIPTSMPELVAASAQTQKGGAMARPLPVPAGTFGAIPIGGTGPLAAPVAPHDSRTRVAGLVAAGRYNLGQRAGGRSVGLNEELSWEDVGYLAAEAHRVAGPGIAGDGRVPLATFSVPFRDDEVLTGDPEHDGGVIERAVTGAQSQTPEALTASGHCAPPVSIYTFCDLAAADGIWDVPMVGAPRGAVQWPVSPTIAEWMARNTNWLWTVTEDADPLAVKECFEIDCATYQAPCVVEDHYLCLKFGNMTSRSWPELYQHQIRLALLAHRYRVSFRHLQRAVAVSTPAVIDGVNDSTYSAVMDAVELHVEGMRESMTTSSNLVFEAAFPMWTLAMLRSDLSRRTGVDLRTVLDAQIISDMTARGARPQFVRGLQPLVPGAGVPTDYPTSLNFMLYPAGRFLGLTQPSLNLGMEIRDMSTITTNTFAGFVEDSSVVCAPCFESRIVTVNSLNRGGRSGIANIATVF